MIKEMQTRIHPVTIMKLSRNIADCTGDNSINEATENEVGDFFMKEVEKLTRKLKF